MTYQCPHMIGDTVISRISEYHGEVVKVIDTLHVEVHFLPDVFPALVQACYIEDIRSLEKHGG